MNFHHNRPSLFFIITLVWSLCTIPSLQAQVQGQKYESRYYSHYDERRNGIVDLDFSIEYTVTYLAKEERVRFRIVYSPITVNPSAGYRYNGAIYGREVKGLYEALSQVKVVNPTVTIAAKVNTLTVLSKKILLTYTSGGFAMSDEIFLDGVTEFDWKVKKYYLSIQALHQVQYSGSHTYATFESLIENHIASNRRLENLDQKIKEGIGFYNRKNYTQAKETFNHAQSIFTNLSQEEKQKTDNGKKIEQYLRYIEDELARIKQKEEEERKKQEQEEEEKKKQEHEEKKKQEEETEQEKQQEKEMKEQDGQERNGNDEEKDKNEVSKSDLEKSYKKPKEQKQEEEYDHESWCLRLQASIPLYYKNYKTEMRNEEARRSVLNSIEQLQSACPQYLTQEIQQIFNELTAKVEIITAVGNSHVADVRMKAHEGRIIEQQERESKRMMLQGKQLERQKQYDEWVSQARERQASYEAEAMASTATFLYLTGIIMYSGMGVPNKDPYSVYVPKMGTTNFYFGINLGYSGTMMPLLHPSKIVTVQNGNPVEEKKITSATLYTINLDPKVKIGAEHDLFTGYVYVNPRVGMNPKANGFNTSYFNYGTELSFGTRHAKLFAGYERGSRSFQWSSSDVEEHGRAKINAKLQKLSAGLKFTTNPNDDYQRTHIFVGAMYDQIDVANEYGRFDHEFVLYNPNTGQLEQDAKSEPILGYTFQVKKDHTFHLFVNVYPKYWYGGQIPHYFPRQYDPEFIESKASPMVQVGFVRALDWFY